MNSQEAPLSGSDKTESDSDELESKTKSKRKRATKSLIEQTITLPPETKQERITLPWLRSESAKPKAEVESEDEPDENQEEPADKPRILSAAEAEPVDEERAPSDGLSTEEKEQVMEALVEADRVERAAELDDASALELTVNELLEEVGDEIIDNQEAPMDAADIVLTRRGLLSEAEPPDKEEFEDGHEVRLSHFDSRPAELQPNDGDSGGAELPPTGSGGEDEPEEPPRRGSLSIPFRPPLRPAAPTSESADRPAEILDQGNPAVTALIGGIIGYLIGRRRGRIKTEKKLLPVQKKLEEQVNDLNWQLKKAEAKVRQTLRQRAEKVMPIAEAVIEKPLAASREQTLSYETIQADRPKAPEASHLHGGAASEQIGHMLMSVETTPSEKAVETKDIKEPVKTEQLVVNQNVATMNRQELLVLSEKIVVEGSSLRQIYETHLIGEKGLRRLVAEHLRGGDLKKALRREITEREIDFERDPVMRDIAGGSGASPAPLKDNVTLQQMIARAENRLPADNEQLAYLRARADYENKQRAVEQKQHQTLDLFFGSLIFILLTIIIILLLTRH